MNTSSVLHNDRLVELLVQRATDGRLNASEQMELNQLLAKHSYNDTNQFDQTAAALLLAGTVEDEPLPKDLRVKLLRQADAFTSGAPAPRSSSVTNIPLQRTERAQGAAATSSRKAIGSGKLAWFAAAASVLVAIAGWWPRLTEVDGGQPVAQTPPPPPTLKEERDMLASQPTVVRRDWEATPDPAAQGVRGDIVWDPQTQKGYMRFSGLAANDPTRQQYQLWIFDATRSDKYPVDGGVFDIPANGGEVVVPIQARLPVGNAAMFAVTLERAGGVVVSEREHILVLAKVG